MKTETCPTPTELSHFSSGTLVDSRAQVIAEHLESCSKCCQSLEKIDATVGFNELLTSSNKQSFGFESEDAYRKIEFSIRQMAASEEIDVDSLNDVLPPEAVIGVYQIRRQLGQGGMGVVYEAVHNRLNKRVALKVLPATLSRRPAFRSRFIREMRAIGALQHENIVSGFDAGESDGHFYLAMEFVDGFNLAELQRRVGRFPLPEACEIARQVANGLDYIHCKKMLHRDIKPSNLMIARNPDGSSTVKILDLGLARLERRQSELSAVTDAGQILGTLEFMSPEQAESTIAVDERADIYSLGATLYKLLTGEGPYSSERYDTPLKMLSAIANVEPEPIKHKTEVPDALATLINSMLSRNPSQRPASALKIAKQLEAYSQHADLSELANTTQTNQLSATVSLSGVDTVCSTRRAEPDTQSIRRETGFGIRWGIAWLALMAVAAGVIWLKTDGGYIKIESPQGIDVTVEVLKDGKFMHSIEAGQSKDSTWYRSGNYEVRLPASGRKSFQLKNNVFTLKYRRKQTVTISRIHQPEITRKTEPSQPRPISRSPPTSVPLLKASEAQRLQREWAEKLNVPVERSVTLAGGAKMIFILIPPGEFLMGSSDEDRNKFRAESELVDDGWSLSHISAEAPQHRVRISKPFYIGKYEMVRSQWKSITGVDPTNRSYHKGDPDVMPVVEITWDQTQEMLKTLNEKETSGDMHFSLPTEAQWEYACRAGTTTAFHFGDLKQATDGNRFWFVKNVNRKEQPVGTSQPNAWGLFDMHGNVHEWVQDRAGQYPSSDLVIDPTGPKTKVSRNDLHVFRGGSSWDPATACRSALRGRRPPDYRFHALGLRLVMSID